MAAAAAPSQLVNTPSAVVDEALAGLVASVPGLVRLEGHRVVLRDDIDTVRDAKVTLLSGGGAGHEPAHAGYVGLGEHRASSCACLGTLDLPST